jgi:hypothetical protein
MLAAIVALTLASSAATTGHPQIVEPDPRTMTRAEIRDHNASLAKEDPFYIKCERQAEIGTLVARKSVCRTNRQWAALEKAGEDQIRGIGSDLTTNLASKSN